MKILLDQSIQECFYQLSTVWTQGVAKQTHRLNDRHVRISHLALCVGHEVIPNRRLRYFIMLLQDLAEPGEVDFDVVSQVCELYVQSYQ